MKLAPRRKRRSTKKLGSVRRRRSAPGSPGRSDQPDPAPARQEDVVVEPQPAMISPSERRRMLRDPARDMEARFLEAN